VGALGGRYWIVMLPSLTVAVGRLVVPSFNTIVPLPCAAGVIVTVNSTPFEADVQFPISAEPTPEKVAVLALAEPLLTSPSITMFWG